MIHKRATEEEWRRAAQKWANWTWGALFSAGVLGYLSFAGPAVVVGLYGFYCMFKSVACSLYANRCAEESSMQARNEPHPVTLKPEDNKTVEAQSDLDNDQKAAIVTVIFSIAKYGGEITDDVSEMIADGLIPFDIPLSIIEPILESVIEDGYSRESLKESVVLLENSSLEIRNDVLGLCKRILKQGYSKKESSEKMLGYLEKTWSLNDSPSSREAFDIAQDWAQFDVTNPTDLNEIRDVSVLPHLKEVILDSLEREIVREGDPNMAAAIGLSAINLAYYQEGVGSAPIRRNGLSGIDLEGVKRLTKDQRRGDEGRDLLESILRAGANSGEWDKFNQLVESDLKRIDKRMKAALARR